MKCGKTLPKYGMFKSKQIAVVAWFRLLLIIRLPVKITKILDIIHRSSPANTGFSCPGVFNCQLSVLNVVIDQKEAR
jgi:hypothetical protein